MPSDIVLEEWLDLWEERVQDDPHARIELFVEEVCNEAIDRFQSSAQKLARIERFLRQVFPADNKLN